mgnify:CR=1 FL=1
MKLTSIMSVFLIAIFMINNCDGVLRGTEKIFIRDKFGLLKEFEGTCTVSIYQKKFTNHKFTFTEKEISVTNGILDYIFIIPPTSAVYIREVYCNGDLFRIDEIEFPRDANIDFNKSIIVK